MQIGSIENRPRFEHSASAPRVVVMAGGKLKKRADENATRVKLLHRALLCSTLLFVLLRLVLRRATAHLLIYALFAVTSAAAWFCYRSLAHIAAPTYDRDGVLVDAGADLSLGGTTSYYHDVIYVAVFLFVSTALVSDWLWLVALVVPAYATYALWAWVILPWIFTPTADEEEANRRMRESKEERKARERAERRAENRRRGRRM